MVVEIVHEPRERNKSKFVEMNTYKHTLRTNYIRNHLKYQAESEKNGGTSTTKKEME